MQFLLPVGDGFSVQTLQKSGPPGTFIGQNLVFKKPHGNSVDTISPGASSNSGEGSMRLVLLRKEHSVFEKFTAPLDAVSKMFSLPEKFTALLDAVSKFVLIVFAINCMV